MNDRSKVQILLATHNGAPFLHEQLRSHQNQTHDPIEILASDDCSSDGTQQVLKEHGVSTLTSDRPLGCIGNFSKLLANRSAPYLAFSDQDDVWLPEKIEHSLKALKTAESLFSDKTPILVHTDLRVVDAELKRLGSSFWSYTRIDPLNKSNFSHLLVQNNVTGCTMLINEALADLIGEVPKEAMMHDWWIALVASALGKVIPVDKATMLYRQHGKNTLGAKKSGFKTYLEKAMKPQIFKIIHERQLRRRTQAEKFLERYEAKLSSVQITLLKTVIQAKDHHWAHNQLKAYKLDLLRQNSLSRGISFCLSNPF